MNERIKIFDEVDWTTIILYLVLIAFGWLNVFASSYNSEQFRTIFDLQRNYGDQLVWILISFVMIILVFALDHRFYHFFAYPVFAMMILMLVAVLVFGKEVNNSRSWFSIAGFNLQPSEFVKPATALALARYLSTFNVRLNSWKPITISGLIIAIPAMLILVQPDWGTAVVFICFLIVLYREGMPGWIAGTILFACTLFLMTLLLSTENVIIFLVCCAASGFGILYRKTKYAIIPAVIFFLIYFSLKLTVRLLSLPLESQKVILITLALSSIAFLVFAYIRKIKHVLVIILILLALVGFTFSVDYVFHSFLKPHQQMRVNIILGKETDTQSVGYNLNQSKIAIGSGGFIGKGFLKGTQTKYNFVPEQSTDFIFCTIGEEWGFLGTTLVIVAFAGMLVRIIFLAERQKSAFARIYGYGVASVLFFHVAINIAMTIGLFPVIGIPLPFFSYGGSSMISFTVLLFIFLRLDSVRKIYAR